MAEDLSLLFRIRGDAAGAKTAAAETRAAIASLRTQSRSDFTSIGQAGNSAFKLLGDSMNANIIQRVPLVGGAFIKLTGNVEEFGAAAGALAGPIGIAVAALGALTLGAIAVTKEFLDLTVSTADWQGKLFDLSQQVGVSTETLSALEVVASQTGGSLDQVVASLGIFQKNLEDAQDPTTKQAEAFKKLGVETKDTEQALRDTIRALAEMPEGFTQTAASLELFGRGGKSVLAIAKETNGDLDLTIRKLRELGLVVLPEDAKAADAFNDQLKQVQLQLRATTAAIVKEAIPQILSALQEVSKVLKDNAEIIKILGNTVRTEVEADMMVLRGLLGLLNSIRDAWVGIRDAARGAFGISPPGSVAGADVGAELNLPPRLSGGSLTLGAGITRQRGAGGGGGGAAQKVSEGQRLLNSLIDEYNRVLAKKNDLDKLDIVNAELLLDKYKNLDPKIKSRIIAYGLLIKGEEDEEKAQKANTEANREYLAVINQIREAMNRTTAERISLEAQIADAVQDQREALSELQGFEKTHLQVVEEYIAQAVKQAEAVGGVTVKMKEYFAILIQIAAKEDEIVANKKRFEGVEGGAEGSGPIQQTGSAIDQLFRAAHDNLSGTKQTAALAGLEALTAGFEGLGQAIGQVVQAWVLYGSAGQSVRQVTAQILAGVAQQAAVKAVFELAEGFATLALAFFGMPTAAGAAAAHFQAAALYGVVAGVTALAGRAVAGNSFANSGGRGGGSSSGGGGGSRSGSSSSSSEIPTRDVNRNTLATQTISHELTFKVKGDAVVEHFVQDYNLNGKTRIIIKSDGQG